MRWLLVGVLIAGCESEGENERSLEERCTAFATEYVHEANVNCPLGWDEEAEGELVQGETEACPGEALTIDGPYSDETMSEILDCAEAQPCEYTDCRPRRDLWD